MLGLRKRRKQGCRPWDGGHWEGRPVQRPRGPEAQLSGQLLGLRRVWSTEDSGNCNAGRCGEAGAAERAREDEGPRAEADKPPSRISAARGTEKWESSCGL